MEISDAVTSLAALAQPTRLEAFRHLVRREPVGEPAGDLARALSVPQNTLSTHLAILVRAGLAKSERSGRSIIYRADLQRFREIMAYLLNDCCEGRPEICAPLFADLAACCPPSEVAVP